MSNVLEIAKSFLGTPYVWGGESISEGGFDCSGYVYRVFSLVDPTVKRDTAQGYFNKYKNCPGSDGPGALYFFGKSVNTITHVAISCGDGVYMYESIGNKSNTKKKPGKGVTLSKVTRRKDLIAIKNPFKQTEPVANYTLRRGDMGVEVNRLQHNLNSACGYNLLCDGKFGPKTYKALRDFQRTNKLVCDGVYGPITYCKMREVLWR